MLIRAFVVSFVFIGLIAGATLRGEERQTANAPTIDPLPAGWRHGEDTPAMHQGQNDELKAFFDVIAEPKTMAFDAWCKKAKQREEKNSPLSDEHESPVKSEKIGGYNVVTYDTTGTLFGTAAHNRIYFVELPNEFARLSCSCHESVWEKVAAVADDFVKKMTPPPRAE